MRSKRTPEPASPKTFVFGSGCQKGGTTWLYKYLRDSPQFARGYRKEYHVFDSLDLPSERWMQRRILQLAAESLAAAERGEPANALVVHRASMYLDTRLYVSYFSELLHRRPATRAAADLTPDYALLSAERFAGVRTDFAKRGIRTVSIFLMRDPVDRLWSQIRMQHARRPERFADPPLVVLRDRHGDPEYALRNDYHRTITTLDSVFGSDDVHYGFYEELFTEGETRAICDFIGIHHLPPPVGRRHNVSEPGADLDDATVELVAGHYRDVYLAVAAKFPERDLMTLWPNSRWVL